MAIDPFEAFRQKRLEQKKSEAPAPKLTLKTPTGTPAEASAPSDDPSSESAQPNTPEPNTDTPDPGTTAESTSPAGTAGGAEFTSDRYEKIAPGTPETRPEGFEDHKTDPQDRPDGESGETPDAFQKY